MYLYTSKLPVKHVVGGQGQRPTLLPSPPTASGRDLASHPTTLGPDLLPPFPAHRFRLRLIPILLPLSPTCHFRSGSPPQYFGCRPVCPPPPASQDQGVGRGEEFANGMQLRAATGNTPFPPSPLPCCLPLPASCLGARAALLALTFHSGPSVPCHGGTVLCVGGVRLALHCQHPTSPPPPRRRAGGGGVETALLLPFHHGGALVPTVPLCLQEAGPGGARPVLLALPPTLAPLALLSWQHSATCLCLCKALWWLLRHPECE